MTSQLSLYAGRRRLEKIFEHMQRGLIYPSPYACFVTCSCKDDAHRGKITKDELSDLMKDLRVEIHKNYGKAHTAAVVGVSFSLWTKWCEEEGKKPPDGMIFKYEEPGTRADYKTSLVFSRTSSFVDSKDDLWFHIKSDNEEHIPSVTQYIREYLTNKLGIDSSWCPQPAKTRSTKPDLSDGKTVGRRFSEGLNNPSDPINLGNNTIIGYEDINNIGGSFVLAQRLKINWSQIHAMTEEGIEDMIGRKADDNIIPKQDERTHIKSARARDENGDTTFVLRLGLSFGSSQYPGGPKSEEEGSYFAGFVKDVKVLETIMDQMIGETDKFMQDRLFDTLKADIGGFFYIPSCKNLGLPPLEWSGDLTRYPGIDWQRISRHFKKRSPNGVMFYNHKDYLFTMATAKNEDMEKLNPPSYRILTLLANSFALWQDNWYFNRKQEEICPLEDYVKAAYGTKKAKEVMALSVMERKGWATKMTLRLSSSTDYGLRGQHKNKKNGKITNGANTFYIHPQEIIVGGMPNLSLGQGRYVMKFLTKEESMEGYLKDLSEASGVGHVVPGHERVLKHGISGLIDQVQTKLDTIDGDDDDDESKRSFYRSVILSLEGVVDYCRNYAQLAHQMACKLKPCQVATKDNLLGIEERMKKLANGKPQTMTDAVQLLFTMHVCLSLNGEPCGIGRIDQLIYPFYLADLKARRITETGAQEVMDAFWIKLGEKVQQNRMMREDHQPFGNLAMGGASGPYPKGGGNNQWIQQITVGGTAADGTMAYNPLTKLALRASRLPLNAPCLSLRVRQDIPMEYLEEAAKTLKTGGAHPIFLNDDKLIPALQASGDRVGGDVAQSSKWKSNVTLESARNYACDGCYEPQFPGENWFTLGGFSALNPLECALNRGRLYVTAGPTYILGKNISFTSRDVKDIECFDDLLDLYREHFRWLITKPISGQIGLYGTASGVCPSPLLSVLMDDCIEKGRDIYGGGTKYNVFAPCFFAIPSVINSLYAIQYMVFEETTAVTTLPELVHCLICDWGYKMVEPLVSSLVGGSRLEQTAERYKRLRDVALSLPRFGRGNSEVDTLGKKLLNIIAEETVKVFTDPIKPIKDNMARFCEKFGSNEYPFGFQIQPGVGCFENYADFGYENGASADGRRAHESLSSDLSPAPTPRDLAPQQAKNSPGFCKVLKGYTGEGVNCFSNGAATDFNIDEEYPESDLVDALKAFANGEGPNVMTVTCASSDTLDEARKNPEAYDLLRLRMGGWTEFYTAMYPHNQEQHRRRPHNVPDQQTP